MRNKNTLSVIIGSIALGLLHKKVKNRGGSMSEVEILEQIDDATWLIENNRSDLVYHANIKAEDLVGFNDMDWSKFPNLESILIYGNSRSRWGNEDILPEIIRVGNIFNRDNFVSKDGISLKFVDVLILDPENILKSKNIWNLELVSTPFEFFDFSGLNKSGKWQNLIIDDKYRLSVADAILDSINLVAIENNLDYRYDPNKPFKLPASLFSDFKNLIKINSSILIELPSKINPYFSPRQNNFMGKPYGLRIIEINNVSNKFFPEISKNNAIQEIKIRPSENILHFKIQSIELKRLIDSLSYVTKEQGFSAPNLNNLIKFWNNSSKEYSELRSF